MITDTAIVCPDVAGGTAQCAIGPTALHPAPPWPLTPFFTLPGTIRTRALA